MPKEPPKALSNPLLQGRNRKYVVAVIAVITVMVIAAVCSLYRASHDGLNLFLFNQKTTTAPRVTLPQPSPFSPQSPQH